MSIVDETVRQLLTHADATISAGQSPSNSIYCCSTNPAPDETKEIDIAAATAIAARDAGGPPLTAQVLIYPLVDPIAQTASRQEYAQGYIIHLAALEWFGGQYVSGPQDVTDPRLAPNRTPNLAGLPATLIFTDEYDTLRDEADSYGEQLRQAGGDVTVTRFDGLVHGVYWMSAAVPRSQEQHMAIVAFLREKLG